MSNSIRTPSKKIPRGTPSRGRTPRGTPSKARTPIGTPSRALTPRSPYLQQQPKPKRRNTRRTPSRRKGTPSRGLSKLSKSNRQAISVYGKIKFGPTQIIEITPRGKRRTSPFTKQPTPGIVPRKGSQAAYIKRMKVERMQKKKKEREQARRRKSLSSSSSSITGTRLTFGGKKTRRKQKRRYRRKSTRRR